MKRPSLSVPFLVTIGVSSLHCGSTVVMDGEAEEGTGGQTTTSTSSSSVGGSGSGGQTTASSSTGTNPPAPCPAEAPDGYTSCDLPPDQICTYDVPCQSGVRSLSFVCDAGMFVFTDQACVEPYDSCPGTEYYCDGSWWMPALTNPPSPCPEVIPPDGTPCYPGGMGNDWEHCGYACDGKDASSGWTVVSCVEDGGSFAWESDAYCINNP